MTLMMWRFSSGQLLGRVWLFASPWTAALQASLAIFPKLKLMSNWGSDAIQPLILCHPLLQSFPASESFLMSQFFTSGGVSASRSVLPMNIQDWFPLGLTGLISLQPKALWRIFSNTRVQKHQFFSPQPSLWYSSHINTWLLEKIALQTFVSKVISLCFLIYCLGWS